MIKMAKIDTRFTTKMAQQPYLAFGCRLYLWDPLADITTETYTSEAPFLLPIEW